MSITRLLWIGPAGGFAAQLAEEPRFDIQWEQRAPRASPSCDLILLDAAAEGAARWLVERKPGSVPVVVHDSTPGSAATWIERGAAAVWPAAGSTETLAESLVAVQNSSRANTASRSEAAAGFVTQSAAMQQVFLRARSAARSRATVLLQGETGTGKELVARAIHDQGPRGALPFVALNCAALPDGLLESELFGHARGAFTGAERERSGAFEQAHTGTLFLDEIGETSAAFQAKLLRVLQERVVRPLGGTRTRGVDVRVIAATHRNLRRDVSTGHFREDLFYRLHVFPIFLPPLRERPEDVIPLAEHFLARFGAAEGKPGCRLSAEAARRLRARPWPGNARELENEIQRALVCARAGAELGAADFADPAPPPPPPAELENVSLDSDEPLQASLARVEAWLIRDALDQHAGRRTDTARKLGLTREGLYKKMKRLGIE